jgi:hypothetical protein
MKLVFSSTLFSRNNQLIISHDRHVPMHVVCSPVADLMFRNKKEQYGEELYEAGPARRKNSG